MCFCGICLIIKDIKLYLRSKDAITLNKACFSYFKELLFVIMV